MLLSCSDVQEIEKLYKIISRIFPGNSKRFNYFLSTCKHIHKRCDLNEIIFKCPHGGIIGIGNSRLDSLLSGSKLFRLHAILHDAHGFMKSEYDVGPGYVYTTAFPVNNCLLGHVTGLAFCLYVKHFKRQVYTVIHC